MMTYKKNELRLGQNDNALDAPRVGEVALRVDGNGVIHVKRLGAEEVEVGGDGGGGVSYDSVIVVDANGGGAYETLGEAIANTVDTDKTFWVFGETTETGPITIDKKVSVYLSPGSVVNLGTDYNILIAPGCDLDVYGLGKILLDNSTLHVITGTGISLPNQAIVRITLATIENLDWGFAFKTNGVDFIIKHATLISNGSSALDVSFDPANTIGYISHSTLTAGGSVIGSLSHWPGAKIYHCDLTGTGLYKVYIEEGNYTNTLNGVNWPAIPPNIDGTSATNGQVWTADGAGGAGWV